MAAPRSYVQVATDGTGKKILNLKTINLNADGSEDVAYVQHVTIVDEDGNTVDFGDNDVQQAILDELRNIRTLLEEMGD